MVVADASGGAAPAYHAVPLLVTAAVLLAGAMHAAWNAIAKGSTDRYAGMCLIGIGQTLCGVLLVWWVPGPAPASWPWLITSVLVHTAYSILLIRAYRLGDFNQAYPLARGVGPLVVAGVAAVALGEWLSITQWLGVAAVSGALGFLAFSRGAGSRAVGATGGWFVRHRPALAAMLAGVSIAGYTLLDGVGVRRSDSPLGYGAWMFVLLGPLILIWAYTVRRSALWPALVAQWKTGLIGGVVSVAAYAIVLWAQTQGALAAVAALRETGVITGALIGVLFFKERLGARRVLASIVIAAGVVLINLH